MNYWLAEVTNLSECHLPFFDYVNSLRGVRTEATHDYTRYPKMVSSRFADGRSRPKTTSSAQGVSSGTRRDRPGTRSISGSTTHSRGTRASCATMAYPVLKEVTEFWEDHLVALPDGAAWPRPTAGARSMVRRRKESLTTRKSSGIFSRTTSKPRRSSIWMRITAQKVSATARETVEAEDRQLGDNCRNGRKTATIFATSIATRRICSRYTRGGRFRPWRHRRWPSC